MDDREKEFFNQLLQLLTQIDPWLTRIDPDSPRATVAPGSPLSTDNHRTDPYQTSYATWHSISHAVDCLHMLRTTLRTGMLHMYAPYSLVRGAMENASTAVWLLAPASRSERVLRRLRLAAVDIHNGEKIKNLIGSVGPRSPEERREQIRDLAQRSSLDPKRALNRPGYGEIVASAGGHAPMGETIASLIWGICSAVAHGDFWSTVAVAAHDELPGAPAGIAHLRVTVNVERLFFSTFFALKMTEHAWRLFDERSRSPY
ncbi:hypothetical protein ACN27G_27600 [Plantactinospora sp. WMMB334]|uniref:hypothetical protein n=1 Tax=Plantactinospora sp. WMMB334 TaxID=3404119 RepID=UPI003B936A20